MTFRVPRTLAACLLLLAAPALARDLTPDEQASLQARIDSFEQAFEQGDIDAVFTVIPPGILATTSETYDITEAQVLTAMKQALAGMMETASIEEYRIDLASATVRETSAGRVYVLIPTTAYVRRDGQDEARRSDTVTLAFQDGDAWYLVRIDDAQQVGVLETAYPDFEGVDFSETRATQGSE
ncbi:hypothetical protein [Roseovarius sp.]|uniref:hypothetical protein n=1 Tax=Roseovarius sp. TaxID=1486281 RepID=UPI003BAC54BD